MSIAPDASTPTAALITAHIIAAARRDVRGTYWRIVGIGVHHGQWLGFELIPTPAIH